MSGSQLCVYCRRQPVDPVWRPFCGERCQLAGLARWADGAYRIPGEPVQAVDAHDGDERGRSTEV